VTERPQRYPYFGVPPAKVPRPAADEPALNGKRVILSMPYGFVYDMRAASEVHTDGTGGAIIDIASEEHYFRARFTHEDPECRPFPAHLVWVE
jgi:hypothetical protein